MCVCVCVQQNDCAPQGYTHTCTHKHTHTHLCLRTMPLRGMAVELSGFESGRRIMPVLKKNRLVFSKKYSKNSARSSKLWAGRQSAWWRTCSETSNKASPRQQPDTWGGEGAGSECLRVRRLKCVLTMQWWWRRALCIDKHAYTCAGRNRDDRDGQIGRQTNEQRHAQREKGIHTPRKIHTHSQ